MKSATTSRIVSRINDFFDELEDVEARMSMIGNDELIECLKQRLVLSKAMGKELKNMKSSLKHNNELTALLFKMFEKSFEKGQTILESRLHKAQGKTKIVFDRQDMLDYVEDLADELIIDISEMNLLENRHIFSETLEFSAMLMRFYEDIVETQERLSIEDETGCWSQSI